MLLVFDNAVISFYVYRTNSDPPHGVGPAGFFRLQNPGLAVNLVQDVPKLGQGLQNQKELIVKLVQSTLTHKKTNTDTLENSKVLLQHSLHCY